MEGIVIAHSVLKTFCEELFGGFGFKREDSETITDVLLLSDLFGIESHGVQRIARYHKGIEKGLIHPHAVLELVVETPVSAVFDAHDGMGQLAASRAMTAAIDKASAVGMSIVTVRNSNHYGIAGYYARMASLRGLIGMSFTNSEAIMVPTNGSIAMLGSNPIAIAFPAEPYPFLFDASTTVVTRGKLEVYHKGREPLHKGWAMDADGNPTTDAAEVLGNITAKKGGGIMPLGGNEEVLGGHKGYGYGMISEIFSSILSLGLTSNHTHINGKGGTCHGFVAINPAVFGDPAEILSHFNGFLQELRDSRKADGCDRIYTHGEKEAEAYSRRLRNGIPIHCNTTVEMIHACKYVGMDYRDYFPDYTANEMDLKTFY